MQNLEKRIAALEEVGKPRDQITIIRRIVSPGYLDAELNHIRDDAGNEWTRQLGESQAGLTDRASRATQPNERGAKGLIASNMRL